MITKNTKAAEIAEELMQMKMSEFDSPLHLHFADKETAKTDIYHYRIIFRPSMIVPDTEMQTP